MNEIREIVEDENKISTVIADDIEFGDGSSSRTRSR